jgi:hemerythrin
MASWPALKAAGLLQLHSRRSANVNDHPDDKRSPYSIAWRDQFQVGIAQVDAEHKRLFSLVKSLCLETANETVEELLEYVVLHFTHEQELMERSGYPAFDQHLKLHEDFGAHVADFLGSGDAWSEERVQELRRFLNRWLIGHILTHDLRFGKWYAELKDKRVAQEAAAVVTPAKAKGFWARLFG